MHSFRAYELPELLTKQDTDKLLPSACCHDFILWQCIVDHLVERELKIPQALCLADGKYPRVLTHVEQNAITYTAGSVIRKLLDRYKFIDKEKTECLNGLIKDRSEIDACDSSEVWLNTTDRGGLYHVTDEGNDLFVEIELFVYHHLLEKDVKDMATLHEMAHKDPDILNIWTECTQEVHEQTSLLHDIIKEWTKLRGHSIANMEMEKYKKKKASTTKKRQAYEKNLSEIHK